MLLKDCIKRKNNFMALQKVVVLKLGEKHLPKFGSYFHRN
jgi:hypothetical protein